MMRFKKSLVTFAVLSALALSGCGVDTDDEDNPTGSGSGSSTTTTDIPYASIETAKFVTEPASGATTFTVTVTLSENATSPITLDYEVTAVSASGSDFVANSDTLEIPVGAKTANISYVVNGDDLDEDDETINIKISNASGANIRSDFDTSLITIRDEDDSSSASFTTNRANVAEGSGAYKVTVQLSTKTERNVSIPFVVSGLATAGQDYTLNTASPLSVIAGTDTVDIDLTILSDTLPEGGESIVLTLQSPTNAELGADNELTLIIPGDIGLNDTGVVTFYDGVNFLNALPQSSFPGQDAEFGADAEGTNVSYDGPAGFSFEKLDSAGNTIPSSSSSFVCVRDNKTGLVWEVKQDTQALPSVSGDALRDHIDTFDYYTDYPYRDSHANWRASNYQYYWFNDESTTNGGAEGSQGTVFPKSGYPIDTICSFPHENEMNYISSANKCNTELYVEAMNDLAICGYKDWRLPEIGEITSIQNYRSSGAELGEEDYFPNTVSGEYITATPSADGTGAAWCMDTSVGQVKLCNKQVPNHIRAVRGGSL
ncbi:DUF1566 domain-containing protein [Vibrio sp. 10N.261.46.E12]|uniref:Lcl C-terminal domain-containing protein n=1 Tax=unclassified Vibrio TaxID=2614977 RepID=UPI000975BDB6|nr:MULTISPECIES: DUF1566 domain-containing protein [unclassified Vibrio]OMO36160.1 hypothetical protein BH584_05130 [Vibrio sp. 10N.261.45.E1]PMJ34488.1 hypothetical protein BCU27_03405 [Vibrio sp. 10N.286.45.B6]PML88016.1 hypothetical protein BCT66_10475 [Vibrio sp. 10N.261.49.E11]PMM67343.1 hypothetical protein BCT48_14945 [Vibrio sp. 10N.261.46.F12]PMM81773.1 hypothetical protein BCT46_15310 [Vibrio sp. 10N.261.46.E8]